MVSARPSQLRKCRQYRGSGGDAGHLFHDNDTKNICHPYVRKTNLSILRFPFAVSEAVRPAATVRRDARRDSPTSWPSPAIRYLSSGSGSSGRVCAASVPSDGSCTSTAWRPRPFAIRRRRISHAAGPCSGRSRGRRLRSVRVRTAESSCASRRCLRGAVRRDSRLHARSLEKTGPSGVRRCPLIRIREQSGFKLQSFDFCGILRVVRGKGEIIFSLRGEICDFFRCNSRKYVKNSN